MGGTTTFTAAETGLPADMLVDADWIQSESPWVCTHISHSNHCHDRAACATGHVADLGSLGGAW